MRIDRSIEFPAVDVFINGRDLADMLREHETRFCGEEGLPDMAGSYRGWSPEFFADRFAEFMGALDPDSAEYYGDKTEVLTCLCGLPFCWPSLVRVDAALEEVRWSEFEQFRRRRKWTCDDFGPFVFDRRQYEEALSNPIQPASR